MLKTLCYFAILCLFISCGPSVEEKQAAEKHTQDSIAAAKVQMDAAMAAARQQAVEDSIAEMDSIEVTE